MSVSTGLLVYKSWNPNHVLMFETLLLNNLPRSFSYKTPGQDFMTSLKCFSHPMTTLQHDWVSFPGSLSDILPFPYWSINWFSSQKPEPFHIPPFICVLLTQPLWAQTLIKTLITWPWHFPPAFTFWLCVTDLCLCEKKVFPESPAAVSNKSPTHVLGLPNLSVRLPFSLFYLTTRWRWAGIQLHTLQWRVHRKQSNCIKIQQRAFAL